jgi:hypothetical protein
MAVDWGQVFGAGAQALGAWASSRSQERVLRTQIRYGGGGYPLGTVPPSMGGAQPMPYGNDALIAPTGAYTPAAFLTGGATEASLLPALPAIAGGAAVATTALRRIIPVLSRWIAPAALVEAASTLIAMGFDGKNPVYTRASDNRVTGIMAGDLKAIRRVKRMGPRLTKALRAAGYGRARSNRKRGATRTRTRVVRVPSHAHLH